MKASENQLTVPYCCAARRSARPAGGRPHTWTCATSDVVGGALRKSVFVDGGEPRCGSRGVGRNCADILFVERY